MGIEQPASYYDAVYRESEKYKGSPHESQMARVWQWFVDRINRSPYLIDFGCGTGQFAEFMGDSKKGCSYYGYDFSVEAIRIANDRMRTKWPYPGNWYEFHCTDITKTDFDFRYKPCVFVMSEFLEHIEDDQGVLERIDKGDKVLLSVPNFDDPAHVRHFKNKKEGFNRYSKHLVMVDSAVIGQWFVYEGVRNG